MGREFYRLWPCSKVSCLNYKPEDKKAFSQVDLLEKTEDVKASSEEPTSMIVVDTRDGVVICKIGSWTTVKIHRQNEAGVRYR